MNRSKEKYDRNAIKNIKKKLKKTSLNKYNKTKQKVVPIFYNQIQLFN